MISLLLSLLFALGVCVAILAIASTVSRYGPSARALFAVAWDREMPEQSRASRSRKHDRLIARRQKSSVRSAPRQPPVVPARMAVAA